MSVHRHTEVPTGLEVNEEQFIGPESEGFKAIAAADLPPEAAIEHVAREADEQDREAAAKREAAEAARQAEEHEPAAEPASQSLTSAEERQGDSDGDGLAEQANDNSGTDTAREASEPEHDDGALPVVAATAGAAALTATAEPPMGRKGWRKAVPGWFFHEGTSVFRRDRVALAIGIGAVATVVAAAWEILLEHSQKITHFAANTHIPTSEVPVAIASAGKGANVLTNVATLPTQLQGVDLSTADPWQVSHLLGHNDMGPIQSTIDQLKASGTADYHLATINGHLELRGATGNALNHTETQQFNQTLAALLGGKR